MRAISPVDTSLEALWRRLDCAEREIAEVRRLLQAWTPVAVRGSDVDWQVKSLGRFALRCGQHTPDQCASRPGRSILRYLLARPEHVATADQLIDTFWPETSPASATRKLQMAIYALRRSLRGCGPNGTDDAILFCDDVYQLNPALQINQDVERFRGAFERGRNALANGRPDEARAAFEAGRRLYAGAYLADTPYEDWADAERAGLQDVQLSLLGHLAAVYASLGEWDAGAECCREILAIDPYREDACRQLMRCQAAIGRAADVQRTYETCRARLRAELNVEPSLETERLASELVRQAPSAALTGT